MNGDQHKGQPILRSRACRVKALDQKGLREDSSNDRPTAIVRFKGYRGPPAE